ncbi:uncharacterized protein RSE6_10190 [Rhynchosporium secalis]|uniref:Uncharacterized protein n=1 Tax=Rhynchosporium secalis TaxID=38038 RepID=A0A1E1MJU3_RHYSE|nr:uncharacterized protein RSE6_10190 [Rhynchosporium secalis]
MLRESWIYDKANQNLNNAISLKAKDKTPFPFERHKTTSNKHNAGIRARQAFEIHTNNSLAISSRDVAKAPVAWEHFVRLGPSVFYLEPTTPKAKHSTYPDLILVAGWMDASPRNLAKYTAKYETLYPSARILAIITTSIDAAFLPNSASLKRIKAAMDILYTLPPSAKVLAHFFSVGGAWSMVNMPSSQNIRARIISDPKTSLT